MPKPIKSTNLKYLRIAYRYNDQDCGSLYGSFFSGDRKKPASGVPARITREFIKSKLNPEIKCPTMWKIVNIEVPRQRLDDIGQFRLNAITSEWTSLDNAGLDIGMLEWVFYSPEELKKHNEEKQKYTNWKEKSKHSPVLAELNKMPLPKGSPPALDSIFARGSYQGVGYHAKAVMNNPEKYGIYDSWSLYDWQMKQLKKLHMNVIHASLPPTYNNETMIKLAHKNGLYIYGHGPVIYRNDMGLKPIAQQQAEWGKIKANLPAVLKRYQDIPTIIAWEVCDEPCQEDIPYLVKYREIMKAENCQHPVVNIYNNPVTIKLDLQSKLPPRGACCDIYVFKHFAPRYTQAQSRFHYLRVLRNLYETSKKNNTVAWIMPQFAGTKLGEKWRGRRSKFREMTAGEARFQVWTAIVYNCKGIIGFEMYGATNESDLSFKPWMLTFGQEFARIAKIEKLLVAIQRNDNLNLIKVPDNELILSASFTDKSNKKLNFLIIANLDMSNEQAFTLTPLNESQAIHKIDTRNKSAIIDSIAPGSTIKLAPGDGEVFHIGTDEEWKKVKKSYLTGR